MPQLLQVWALPAAILVIVNISATWYNLATSEVPEPYLDEFFHVPQAQKYCMGNYSWDPKITTPPGLYLVAKLLKPFLGCDTNALRAINAGAICLLCPLSYSVLRLLHSSRPKAPQQSEADSPLSSTSDTIEDLSVLHDAHTALNMALFPPLFFFSALFYTDILSTLSVILTYYAYLQSGGSALRMFSTVLLGILALFFRQTNIFWVAVFPAGLSLVETLKKNEGTRSKPVETMQKPGILDACNLDGIRDVSIFDARLSDYILFLITTMVSVLRFPLLTLRAILPYLSLLALFSAFVIWNGSVVLGDKSAHTATLHIPQILYLWPYITFFSLPLLFSPFLRPFAPFLPHQLINALGISDSTLHITLSGLAISIVFGALGLAAVHWNTVVHPYTLADNRHFVFYVFRILRRHMAVRYLAVPVYVLCAWLVVAALASRSSKTFNEEDRNSAAEPPVQKKTQDQQPNNKPKPSQDGVKISFLIIYLASTSLSLITAPLVEPRYFIIPWIIWRLHVPFCQTTAPTKTRIDVRLCLETVWSLTINVGVGYVFLYWGFEWESERGKVQRFLW